MIDANGVKGVVRWAWIGGVREEISSRVRALRTVTMVVTGIGWLVKYSFLHRDMVMRSVGLMVEIIKVGGVEKPQQQQSL